LTIGTRPNRGAPHNNCQVPRVIQPFSHTHEMRGLSNAALWDMAGYCPASQPASSCNGCDCLTLASCLFFFTAVIGVLHALYLTVYGSFWQGEFPFSNRQVQKTKKKVQYRPYPVVCCQPLYSWAFSFKLRLHDFGHLQPPVVASDFSALKAPTDHSR
jgi:hypothetical protein